MHRCLKMSKMFNLESMKLDLMKKMVFEDFLRYKLTKDTKFGFVEFSKACGISRKQWDVFKIDNRDIKEIKWLIE